MNQVLLSPPEAARIIGVSVRVVKEWMRRANEPLPSVVVGASGRTVKVIASEIEPWLAAEAARKASAVSGGRK